MIGGSVQTFLGFRVPKWTQYVSTHTDLTVQNIFGYNTEESKYILQVSSSWFLKHLC